MILQWHWQLIIFAFAWCYTNAMWKRIKKKIKNSNKLIKKYHMTENMICSANNNNNDNKLMSSPGSQMTQELFLS